MVEGENFELVWGVDESEACKNPVTRFSLEMDVKNGGMGRLSGSVLNIEAMMRLDHTQLFIHESYDFRHGREPNWSFSYRPSQLTGEISFFTPAFEYPFLIYVEEYHDSGNGGGTVLLRHLKKFMPPSSFVIVDYWTDDLDAECRENFLYKQFSGANARWDPNIQGHNFTCAFGHPGQYSDQNMVHEAFAIQVSHSTIYPLENKANLLK